MCGDTCPGLRERAGHARADDSILRFPSQEDAMSKKGRLTICYLAAGIVSMFVGPFFAAELGLPERTTSYWLAVGLFAIIFFAQKHGALPTDEEAEKDESPITLSIGTKAYERRDTRE
jgi:hypothetical protein